MAKRTPLYDAHIEAGARMVDFGGWDLPINYGSQIEEHHQVRRDAGMFDVSHMTVVDLSGSDVRDYLSRLLANDVSRAQAPGKALYSCMLNGDGGVVDDLITYHLGAEEYRLVVNAATRDKDLAWLQRQSEGFDVGIEERADLALIAVQGPRAREIVLGQLEPGDAAKAEALVPFSATRLGSLFMARTGYTGEDGFEIAMPGDEAVSCWKQLLQAGVHPCGLGARDTLRLEAGMNLYGQDMDESITPLECGLAWTVALQDDRAFVGREALERQLEDGLTRRQVGLVLEGKGILRHGHRIVTEFGEGVVTSGSFSPTLEHAIALARVPAGAMERVQVDIRGKLVEARVVKPPFARQGAVCKGIL